MRNICIAAVTALMLAATAAQGVEYGGEKSYLFEGEYEVCVIPPQVGEAEAQGVKVVSVKKAKELFDNSAVFFDARSPRHYNAERIKGAHPVAFDQSKAKFVAIELPRDKDAALVFYCYGESCANSYEAALAVRKEGYKNVNWLLNGFPQWKANDFPVETGE